MKPPLLVNSRFIFGFTGGVRAKEGLQAKIEKHAIIFTPTNRTLCDIVVLIIQDLFIRNQKYNKIS